MSKTEKLFIIRPFLIDEAPWGGGEIKNSFYEIYAVPDKHRVRHYRGRYIYDNQLVLFSDIKFVSEEEAQKFLESAGYGE